MAMILLCAVALVLGCTAVMIYWIREAAFWAGPKGVEIARKASGLSRTGSDQEVGREEEVGRGEEVGRDEKEEGVKTVEKREGKGNLTGEKEGRGDSTGETLHGKGEGRKGRHTQREAVRRHGGRG